jgi:ABC-type transport system involved in multi-copper enzyme maturation permease subunit
VRTLIALALNGFREASRNRVTVVVFMFAFVMIFSATVSIELTVATFDRVMTDLGLGVMSLICAFLTIFLASGLIPREIERKTIFMILAKPISRTSFVLGRYAGNLVTVFFVLGVMIVLFVGQILTQRSALNHSHLASFVGIALQVVVMTAVAFVFASVSSQYITAVCAAGLYFLGHLSSDLYKMADHAKSEVVQVIGKALYYALPNLDRLDFKARATYNELTTNTELLTATGYALAYSAVMLVIACLLFERRDFK